MADTGETLACDLLCMTAGYMPTYQLLCQAGGQLGYDDAVAEFAITGLPTHLHVAGSVNGYHDLDQVLQDGARAGALAAQALGRETPEVAPPGPTRRRVNHPWPIFAHPKGKEFVDFDEDLQIKDIVNATREGYRDVQLVKRFSTVGMGPSQGRHRPRPSPTWNCVRGMSPACRHACCESASSASRITIRTEGGVEVTAEVVALPFYDPDNARQEL